MGFENHLLLLLAVVVFLLAWLVRVASFAPINWWELGGNMLERFVKSCEWIMDHPIPFALTAAAFFLIGAILWRC